MPVEIRQDSIVVRRDGDKLLIDTFSYKEFDPNIVLRLTDDGGIVLDPDWVTEQKVRADHLERWNTIVKKLLDGSMYWQMRRAPPPRVISTPQMMLEYLAAIADGEIKVRGLGPKGCAILKSALASYRP